MKLIVSKSAIESAAVVLSKVILAKSSLPILADILCEVKDNSLTMTASDSEVFLTRTVSLDEVDGDGRFCVPALQLVGALSNVPEQPVTIIANIEGNMMFTLKHNDGESYFPMCNDDDYPELKEVKYKEHLELDGEIILAALKRSTWCMANDPLRIAMNGVYFCLKDGLLDIVATDAFRIVLSRYMVTCEEDRDSSFIMPAKVAWLLSSILSSFNVSVDWNNQYCRMVINSCTLTFRLVDGKYVNYDSVIPKRFKIEPVLSRTKLAAAIKNVAPFGENGASGVVVRMTFAENRLTLKSESLAMASGASFTIDADYEDEPFEIGLSAKGASALLSHMSEEEILLRMNGYQQIVIVEPVEQQKDGIVIMGIMPMLISNEEE